MKSGRVTKTAPLELHGSTISPGIAVGSAYVFKQIELDALEKNSFAVEDIALEEKRLERAIQKSKSQLHHIKMKTLQTENREISNVFQVHIHLLEDVAFLKHIQDLLRQQQLNIEYVLASQINVIEKRFASIEDENLRRRFADIQDVYHRLLRNLLEIEHVRTNPLKRIQNPVVLIAERLIPSDIALIDLEKILGIVMEKGDETSHVALIAKSLQVPVIVNVPGISSLIRTDDSIIVDGEHGKVIVHPDEEEQQKYAIDRVKKVQQPRKPSVVNRECTTRDGVRVKLEANVGSLYEAEQAAINGAEGVGLLRSELYYMARQHMPTAEEECSFLKRMLAVFKKGEVTVRVLDVGADKDIPYLTFEDEENPQLGMRGIRYLLNHTALFKKQLHSILGACKYGKINILLPFVTLLEDIEAALEVIDEGCRMAGVRRKDIQVGMMVEIPSAALSIEQYVPYIDFFSIGTNDLVQYTFAAGRENRNVEMYRRVTHPVILKMIKHIVSIAHQHQKDVAVCGAIKTPLNACLMAGLGVNTLSVETNLLLPIKEMLMSKDMIDLVNVADESLKAQNSAEVENMLEELAWFH
ncbi:MAG: phosphoenolpyruvate--protein phosphotransferase [Chitinivibrionales bacterium]